MDTEKKKKKKAKPGLWFKAVYMAKGSILTGFLVCVSILTHQVRLNGLEWLTARTYEDDSQQAVVQAAADYNSYMDVQPRHRGRR